MWAQRRLPEHRTEGAIPKPWGATNTPFCNEQGALRHVAAGGAGTLSARRGRPYHEHGRRVRFSRRTSRKGRGVKRRPEALMVEKGAGHPRRR